MLSVNVMFLGPARDFAGSDAATIELPLGSTVADLRGVLVAEYPGLAGAMPTIRFAVNETFTSDDHVLAAGDEVALIPPVSGGEEDDWLYVDLVDEPIELDRVRAFVSGDAALGAIVTFEGTTRQQADEGHGVLKCLDYEAYGAMARRQLDRLAREAQTRWSVGRIAIVHRLGSVPPGEVSVAIAVATAHRVEAFEACRWLIDTLKRDVPIWKKDVFADGSAHWVEP